MDFVSIILFLVMYYIRPQEWGALFSTLHFVQLVMFMSVITLFFRERSVRLADLLKTPHDWAMLAFFSWIVLTSSSRWETFKEVLPLAVFYLVIVQTLVSAPRIRKFVGWWAVLIVALAALAIASEYGFDPLQSFDITHGRMQGRLTINLSIFKNPNALGHNVVPAIPMLYFLFVWKRPIFLKVVGVALILIPLWCIYLTLSKGAFLCCGVTLLATQTFGRPKAVQAIIIAAAILFGGAVLWKLPRMTELDKSRGDAAIQGRVAAFEHGLSRLETHTFGVGYGEWLNDFYAAKRYKKAAHSSYVQTGAELGKTGLFLFFGVLFCNLRTLVTAKTTNVNDERIRRCLFVLVVSYMSSSWMIDFGYRPSYFMFSAAIAAFHRHLSGTWKPELAVETVEAPITWPAWRGQFLPEPKFAGMLVKTGAPALMTLEPVPALEPEFQAARRSLMPPIRARCRGIESAGWISCSPPG